MTDSSTVYDAPNPYTIFAFIQTYGEVDRSELVAYLAERSDDFDTEWSHNFLNYLIGQGKLVESKSGKIRDGVAFPAPPIGGPYFQ